jgi:hypothetical protein
LPKPKRKFARWEEENDTMSVPLETWKEKLEYFQAQEASTADPDQKFALHRWARESEA